MAEATTNGNGQRLQNAAENALLTVLARWGVIAICGLALPVGAWMGSRIISSLDKVVDRVESLNTDVAVMKNDISYLKRK